MRYDLVVRVAVVLLVATGCGDSSSTSAPTPSGPTSSASASPSSATSAPSVSGAAPASSAAPGAPTPAEPPPAAQPPVLGTPSTPVAAPKPPGDKGKAYLAALTAAGVPTSTTGATEIQIAQGVCNGLAAGTPRAKLVTDIAGIGGLLTEDNAEAMVAAAQAHYC